MDKLDVLVLLLSVPMELFEATLVTRASLMTGKLERAVDWSIGRIVAMERMVSSFNRPAVIHD